MNIYAIGTIIWCLSALSSIIVTYTIAIELYARRSWTGFLLFTIYGGMTCFSVLCAGANYCETTKIIQHEYTHQLVQYGLLVTACVIICINSLYILIKNNKL